MTIIAGAVCFSGAWNADERALQLASRSAPFAHLQARRVFVAPGAALYSVQRSGSRFSEISCSDESAESWLFGDINYAPAAMTKSLKPLTAPHHAAWESVGRWVVVSRSKASGRIQLTSDRWGLAWVYIARLADGFLFGSDFQAVAGLLPGPLRLNRDACFAELSFGYALEDQTILEDVSLIPAGARIELQPSGIALLEQRMETFGDKYVRKSDREKFSDLDELWRGITERYFRTYRESLAVSISGGYDSRHALHFLPENGIAAKYFTFGDPNSEEVKRATRNCRRAGVRNTVYQFEHGEWDDWKRSIAFLGNTGITQMCGWTEKWLGLIMQNASALVTGIFGGPLTGTHLGREERSEEQWLDYWLAWSGTEWRDYLRTPHDLRLADTFRESFRAISKRATYAFPHQRAVCLDYFTRQRRWTAAQPMLMSRFVTPVPYLYDDAMINFWMNLPFDDLRSQRLYLAYARSRMPRLFPARLNKPTITQRVTRKAMRMIGLGSNEPILPIDRDRIITPNRSAILKLVAEVRSLADEFLDVDKFLGEVEAYPSNRDLGSQHIIRAVNFCLLLKAVS